MSNVFSVNHKTMFNWFTFHGSILKVLFIFRDPSGIVFFYLALCQSEWVNLLKL